jgi:hypothetical protein
MLDENPIYLATVLFLYVLKTLAMHDNPNDLKSRYYQVIRLYFLIVVNRGLPCILYPC